MKKILMLMSIVAMALMFSVSTASAWYLSLEPISVLPNCEQVAIGDIFYADVFFNPDAGGNFLQQYEFAVGFDAAELTWNSGTAAAQNTPPSPLMLLFGPPQLNSSGQVENFSAALFGPDGATLTAKTRLAHIEFTATPDMYCDGELDVWFADSPMGAELLLVDHVPTYFLDTPGYILQGPSISQTGNPVPIPGAVFLLGSGLLGLIGVRKRKVMG